MSFFSDFLKEIDIGDVDFYVKIILHKMISISGSFKIVDFNEGLILIDIKNKLFKIVGSGLNIKSLTKNEMIVNGNVLGFIGE